MKKSMIRLIPLLLLALPLAVCNATEDFQYLPEITEDVVLKPEMRPLLLTETLFTSNTEDLAVYIENILMFNTQAEFDNLPYIISFEQDNHLAGPGDTAYAIGLDEGTDISFYNILKPGKIFTDPEDNSMIGFQAFVVGTATLKAMGTPQTIEIVKTRAFIAPGNKLIANTAIDLPAVIEAKYPNKAMQGYVIAVQENEVGGGANAYLIISLGKRDGLVQGNVLDLTEGKRVVADLVTTNSVDLPTVKFGQVMIYKVAEKSSLAIVTYAHRMVAPKDIVAVTPQDF